MMAFCFFCNYKKILSKKEEKWIHMSNKWEMLIEE